MTRRPVRILARVLGIGLIAVVLYLVGWQDRVTDTDGREHFGRVIERSEHAVVLEGGATIPIEDARAVRTGLRTAFSTLARRPGPALLGVLLHLLAMITTYARWGFLLAGADLRTPWKEVYRLGWIGQFMGSVLPGGIGTGDLVKAFYVARSHGDKKTRAVVTVFVDRVIGLVALCLLAAVAVLFAPEGSRLETARTIVLAIFLIGVACLILLFSRKIRRRLRVTHALRLLPFQTVVHEAEQAVEIYGRRPGVILGAAGLSLLGHALFLAAFFFYAAALDEPLSLVAVGVAIPVAQILAAIPGLPGGWGVGDFAFFAFLPEAGVAPANAVALSFVYRLLHMLLALPGGLWLARSGERVDPDRLAEEMTVA